jgi:hypothetical protein
MSISLSNGHARATVLSAVWSPVDQQLVAVLMAATDKTVLKALKAELEKNNKNSCVALTGDAKAELTGAKRGYIQLSASLEKVNAQGHVMALLHWRAHDPRAIAAPRKPAGKDDELPALETDYFYVVSRRGECLSSLFMERLQLALAWALRPEWADPLLELGRQVELVECLPACPVIESEGPKVSRSGETGLVVDHLCYRGFLGALRVIRDEARWGELIGSALAAGSISL